LSARYPRTTSYAAENGTRLHGLAATALSGGGRVYSSEDAKAIDAYIDDVQREHSSRLNSKIYVEIETWWALLVGLRGTPDAVVVDWINKHIIIWDLKTGWRIVEAFLNWQLACYGLMYNRPGWTLELRIVQSLPYHPDGPVRSWSLTAEELARYGPIVQGAFNEASAPNAVTRPGGHCLYCDALSGCKAARDVSLAAVEYAAGEPVELPDDRIGRELEVLRETVKILQIRMGALEESTAVRLRKGAQIPGVAMRENSGGRTKWAVDEAQARAMITMLTGKDPTVPSLPTPTQLKNAGLSEEMLRPLTKYQPGKMVVSTDVNDQAKKAFGTPPNMEYTK
jgi:hypothetical protein